MEMAEPGTERLQQKEESTKTLHRGEKNVKAKRWHTVTIENEQKPVIKSSECEKLGMTEWEC